MYRYIYNPTHLLTEHHTSVNNVRLWLKVLEESSRNLETLTFFPNCLHSPSYIVPKSIPVFQKGFKREVATKRRKRQNTFMYMGWYKLP